MEHTHATERPDAQFFRDVFEASPIGIAVENLEGQPVFVNPAFCSMLGFSEEELRTKHCVDFAPAEDAEKDWVLFQKLRAGFIDHYQLEKRYCRRDGSLVWGRLSVSLLKGGASPLVIAMVEDITEKRAAVDREHDLLEMMSSITKQMAAAVTRCSRDFRYEWVNQAYADWIQRPVNELVDRSISEVLGKEAFDSLLPYFQRVLKGETVQYERETNFQGIGRRWTSVTYTPTFDAEGATDGWVAVVLDLTDRKRAEERLREYEKAVEGAEDMIGVIDREYRFLLANRQYLKMRNLTREQVVGHPIPEVLNKELFETVIKPNLDQCFQGKVVRYERTFSYPEVGERHLMISYFPVESANGTIDRAACILRDVTEHKQVEQTAFRHTAILGSSDDAIIATDLSGTVTDWNKGAERLFNYLASDAIGKNISFLSTPDRAQDAQGILKKVRHGEAVRHHETVRRRKDGTPVDISLTVSPILDAASRVVGASGVAHDITERKRAEEALQQREMELTEAQRLAGVGSWQWEPRTDTVTWSKELYRLMGIDPTLPAPSYQEHALLFAPESWERLQRAVQRAMQTGASYELDLQVVRPESIAKWEIARGEPVRDKSGQIIGLRGTVQDITERKQAEEALRESEDKHRLLLNSTAEAIYGIDLEHRCTFCNPAFLRALGYERIDEVLGKNMHDLIHHTRADGALFPAEECRVHRVLTTGEGDHSVDEVLWRANGTSFPAEYWSYPQRRGQELVGAVVTFIDITQRKLAEGTLANVNRRLIEAQERERTRIGRELHDDINQRLAMLALELEQMQSNPSEVQTRLPELRKQTAELSNDVQALSHELHSSKLEYLGVVPGIKSWCKEFGEHQKMQIDFKSDVSSVVPFEIGICLFRVLQESLHNAAKHSAVKRIEVRLQEVPNEIHLIVTDLGRGFDVEVALQGQGLGLTSMRERVRLVNGSIEIQSKPMGGTTIQIKVPLESAHATRLAG